MAKALDDAEIAEPMRATLRAFFKRSTTYVVNTGPVPSVEPDCGAPPGGIRREISRRWASQCVLDAIAAIRNADADHAIALAEIPPLSEAAPSLRHCSP